MVPGAALRQHPLVARVIRSQNDAARARDHDAWTVLHVETVKRRAGRCHLLFPLEAAVIRRQYDTVRAHGPTAFFISSEFDRIDGIAMGKRFLPLPATCRILRARRGRDEETD